ncbi:MAG: hypothetical protein GXO47_05370 [Chlorobi bacterium]|nr:hypothetical protein [Chlorobiota bacterium]
MQKIRKRHKIILLTAMAVFSILPAAVNAQMVSVNARLDSSLMYIGGQMNLTLELNQPKDVFVKFPEYTDTITKSIEIVSQTPVDTTFLENNRLTLTKKYRITSFDSGLQYIPPMVFELAEDQVKKIYKTEPMALQVVNPFQNVDPKKGIADIKKPLDTPFILAELIPYLPWIFGGLALVGLIIYLIYRYRKNKQQEGGTKKQKPKEPPHVTALRNLNRIKEEKLWQHDKVKKYHSELTDTIRQYIEDRFGVNALEQTTEETLEAMKKVDLNDREVLDKLQQILELADLVKFAKFKPLPDENELSMINALFFVNQTKKEMIKSLEDQQKELEKKEEKVSGKTESAEKKEDNKTND